MAAASPPGPKPEITVKSARSASARSAASATPLPASRQASIGKPLACRAMPAYSPSLEPSSSFWTAGGVVRQRVSAQRMNLASTPKPSWR